MNKKRIGERKTIYTDLHSFESKSLFELRELLKEVDGEIESLDIRKRRLENEIFYRLNPECIPK